MRYRTSNLGGYSRGTDDSASRQRLAGLIVLVLALLLIVAAVVLAVGSFSSYDTVKQRLDGFVADGDADFSPRAFDAAVLRMRLGAALVALTGLTVYLGRAPTSRRVAGLLASIGAAGSALVVGLRAAIAAESRVHLGVLAALTATGLLLRVAYLFQPMRYDEANTYLQFASQPWYVALTTYPAPNNHVFHSLLVHLSTTVFGGEPWAIRMPALVAGVLLVPGTYLAARALYGRDAALVAAALVAVSSVLVEFSVNARGYTIAALVFVLLVALATRLVASDNQAEWLAFAVLAAIGFFTVPVMLYGYGAIVAWLAIVLRHMRQRLAKRLVPAAVLSVALTAALYLPIAATSGLGVLVDNEFVEPLPWTTFGQRLPDSLASTFEEWHRDVPLLVTVALVAGFVAGLAHHRWRAAGPPPAVVALVWSLVAVAAQRVVPFERVWLIVLPLYLLTSAAGLMFLLRPLLRARPGFLRPAAATLLAATLGTAVIASGSVPASETTSTFRDAERVARFLAGDLRPGDKVVAAPPSDAILEYQLDRRGLHAGALLYWSSAGTTGRFVVVVKEGVDAYPLSYLLADPRLEGLQPHEPVLLRRYDAARIYELRVAGRLNRKLRISPGRRQ